MSGVFSRERVSYYAFADDGKRVGKGLSHSHAGCNNVSELAALIHTFKGLLTRSRKLQQHFQAQASPIIWGFLTHTRELQLKVDKVTQGFLTFSRKLRLFPPVAAQHKGVSGVFSRAQRRTGRGFLSRLCKLQLSDSYLCFLCCEGISPQTCKLQPTALEQLSTKYRGLLALRAS